MIKNTVILGAYVICHVSWVDKRRGLKVGTSKEVLALPRIGSRVFPEMFLDVTLKSANFSAF